MATNYLKMLSGSIKHWYLSLIAGIIFIGVGILVFSTPLESYVTLSIIFSVSFLVTGIMDSIFSITNRDEMEGWGWNLALGLLTIVVGILLIIHPEVSMVTLPFIVGFVVLFRSIMAIGVALDLRSYYVLDWGYLMVMGVLGVIFSFILLWNPVFAGMTLIFWTALAFIVLGVHSIYVSLKLKKLHDIPKKISKELKDKFNQVKQDIQKEIIKATDELKTSKQ